MHLGIPKCVYLLYMNLLRIETIVVIGIFIVEFGIETKLIFFDVYIYEYYEDKNHRWGIFIVLENIRLPNGASSSTG